MFDYIKGTLQEKYSEYLVVECNNYGIIVHVPQMLLLGADKSMGEDIFLYTSVQIRENSFTIYGFETRVEKLLFELLVTISGIGPKVAMAILSTIAIDEFGEIVENNNVTRLQDVPGIGKKSAEKILFELHSRGDKLDLLVTTKIHTDDSSNLNIETSDPATEQVLEALVQLGWKPTQARVALKKALENSKELFPEKKVDSPTLLRLCLVELNTKK